MTRKTNTMLIALLGTILTGLATWTSRHTYRTSVNSNNDPIGPNVY